MWRRAPEVDPASTITVAMDSPDMTTLRSANVPFAGLWWGRNWVRRAPPLDRMRSARSRFFAG